MKQTRASTTDQITVPPRFLEQWQTVVDLMARLVDVPAGLVMRVVGPEIGVLVSSGTEGNPYEAGDSESVWGSGLYCETVLETNARLLVPNALDDPDWRDNPDVKLNMLSYMGYPIRWPDGDPFGTLCVLDSKTNGYSPLHERLLETLRSLIEGDLQLIHASHRVGGAPQSVAEIADEVEELRRMVPICCVCKDVRDDAGEWKSIEEYVAKTTGDEFTHGLCTPCKDEQAAAFRSER
jgi:GAF domain-containing protein